MATRRYRVTSEQIREVLDWAVVHKCVINPTGYEYYLTGYNEFGHCVCDKNRPACPCQEAPQEIKEKGHCLCHLFWRSYEDYIKAKGL